MEDTDYDRKFNEMQKYIPFLDRVIEKLKNNDQDKPRKAQLEKMQTLHSLLNNKEKRLKMETLLKCESVLKKLYAKIEKPDDVVPSIPLTNVTTTTTSKSSDTAAVTKVHTPTPALETAASRVTPASHIPSYITTSSRNKFVPNRNLIEIHTCPASPPHLGEEDFRPPVEIPTERRSSPVKFVSSPRWEQKSSSKESTEKSIPTHTTTSTASRFQNRSTDFYHGSNIIAHHSPSEPSQKSSRWSDARDSRAKEISPASSSHHKSWSSSSTTSLSTSNKHRSSHSQKSTKYSSEEENWDEPEDEPLPKSKQLDPKPTPPSSSSLYTMYKDSKSSHHHHRHHDKSFKSQIEHLASQPPPPPPPASSYHNLPETNTDNDALQNKLYHETIFNYKKPDAFNSFMNPPPPESRTPQKHSGGNIFNRLGDKVDSYENFSIRVTNDKMKSSKPHRAHTPPPPPPPLLVQNKPIGEVLKSPPLSADDIDDLLNESLEAAMEKQNKISSNDSSKDYPRKAPSLDAVRKKLALISKPASPSPELGSPPRTENKTEEPFYRRGHTPTRKHNDVVQNKNETHLGGQNEATLTSTTVQPSKNTCPLPSPKSPTNPMDKVVERLALKYHPHKRRESVSLERNPMFVTEKPNKSSAVKNDSMGYRSKSRESLVSPVHGTDPRVSRHIPPLMATPISPVPANVLPTINHFDPRLRNTNLLNKDHNIPFSVPKPPYHSPIPSLLDLHVNIPISPNCINPPLSSFKGPTNTVKPPANSIQPPIPNYISPNSNRIDPRKKNTASKLYADKFNAERNDKTERMKYLESKKNKPPEPKTYGEYRKCRQQLVAEEVAAAKTSTTTTTESDIPDAPTIQSTMPSTLDKMYRNADYGKEMTGSIQGFKIPKKPKTIEEPPKIDLKKDDQELKSSSDESVKTVESVSKGDETLKKSKKSEEDLSKKSEINPTIDEPAVTPKLEDPLICNELPKQKEKLPKQKVQDEETKKEDIPETKKTTKKTNQVIESETETKIHKTGKEGKIRKTTQRQPKEIIYVVDSDNEVNESFDVEPSLNCSSQNSELLDMSVDSRLVIDETPPESLNDDKSKEEEEEKTTTPTATTVVADEKDESENNSPEPRIMRSRRLQNKKTVAIENTPSPEKIEIKFPTPLPPPPPPAADKSKSKVNEEKIEEVFIPRRITTRRSTILMREAAESEPQVERRKSESPCSRRSASDIFSPTTDNSVVSTQNIITGKRRTRASINFNEKMTKKPSTPKTPAVTTAAAAASTPPSKTPTQTPKSKNGGTKKGKSVSTQQKKDVVEKKSLEDGQICAVSSTTEGPHNEPSIVSENCASAEEPSSSNATDPQTPLLDADNKKKQEFLEGFLMSITDPTTNKDRILDMLKSVLDETKLQQVKEILYSPVKGDSKNASDKTKEHQEHDQDHDHDHEQEPNKPRATRTKKNELDRLNEDIRDMFICQGVVTATGRRMCTLAKETSSKEAKDKKPVQIQKKKKVQAKTPSKQPQLVTPAPASQVPKRRMRRAKVLISPLNMRALRSRNPKPANSSPKMPVLAPNTPIKLPDEQPKGKNKKITNEHISETSTMDEDDEEVFKPLKKKSDTKSTKTSKTNEEEEDDEEMFKPLKKKSEAKSTKTSKTDEEDDEEMFKPLKKKPGPKSKRQPSECSDSDSSDDDIELVYLKNKIKRMDEMKTDAVKNKKLKVDTKVAEEETKQKVLPKEEETKPKVVLPKEETKPKVVVSKEETKTKVALPKEETKPKSDEMKKKPIDTKEITTTIVVVDSKDESPKEVLGELFIKNTNPEFHTKSDYANCCVICKEKARFIATHYLIAHHDSEVYTSRLPPAVLEDIKLNIGNRALYSVPKKPQVAYQHCCPFCDFKSSHTLRGWMEHFTIHTGEYGHKCSKCFKGTNGSTLMTDHLKRVCPDGKKINRDPINLRGNALLAYVCQLCNFTQMLRLGVVRHLKIHHGLEDTVVIAGNIFQIKLIDIAGVPKIDDIKTHESTTNTDTRTSVLSVPDVVASIPKDSSMVIEDEDPLKLTEEDNLIALDSSAANTILLSEDKSTEEKIIDDNEESSKEPSISIVSNMEAFLPRDLVSPASVDLTERSNAMETDEIIDLDCSVVTEKEPPPPTPPTSEITSVGKPPNKAINSNMEVFLPRDLSSPTSIVLTESLKSIEKGDSDSGVNKNKPTVKRMTIAEKLSQRFKNIEKQNIADDAAATDVIQENILPAEKEVSLTSSIPVDVEMEERPSTSEKTPIQLSIPSSPAASALNQSLNESGGGDLVIDEQIQNDSLTRDDDGSDSDDADNQIEEDDNDNWEDIEITETKGGTQKDKNNKNKSIYKTLSRLYASIAPKKITKKAKEKEKKKADTLERPQKTPEPATSTSKTNDKPTSEVMLDPLIAGPKSTQQLLPNLSEFIIDSQTDSLDILLNSNFNCLEGDGSSFPHLDLNDLESSIFPLPEDQENIQDAIAMATDMDHTKYDLLGNPISLGVKLTQQPHHQQSLSTIIQKIGCFGFSLCGNSLKYYCMVKSCAFLFSDHPDGLQNHFLMDHPNMKWDGYCHTCKMQVSYGDCREMKHLLDVHSKIRTDDAGSGGGDKPRIKFRRLTGDILSTDKPKIESLSNENLFAPLSESSNSTPTRRSPSPIPSPSFTVRSGCNYPSLPKQPSSKLPSSKTQSYSLLSSKPSLDISLSAMLQSEPKVKYPPTAPFISPSHTPELSLSTMLQSEPKAMIPPKAPQVHMDIPLFKNVSKDFTITNVAEGVSDNDLLNLVFKQVDSTPGGIQISQVISLNAGGKSVAHMPMKQLPEHITVTPVPMKQISDQVTLSSERRSSPSLKDVPSSVRDKDQQSSRASPKPISVSLLKTHRVTTPQPRNPTAYVCCVKQCSFSANIRTTMTDHILSHIRRDNNRDSLKCHICSFFGQDTNHYFNHMAQAHSRHEKVATPTCPSTVDLTQKIQDILRNTAKPKPNQSSEQEQQRSTPSPLPPPVEVPKQQVNQPLLPAAKVTKPLDTSFASRIRRTAEEIVADTGLPEDEIWRCIFYPECDCTVSEKDFQTHLATHTSIVPTSFPSIPPGSSLNCPHCTVNYYRAAVLKAHMKTHARHQYFCFICSLSTFANYHQVQKHFSEIHSRSGNIRPQNMIPDEKSDKPSFFVANEIDLTPNELIQFGEKLIVDWERKKAINKTHFQPSEQNLLPLQPIFNQQVCCSVCNYKTKVRTNMFRHLQLHNQDVDVGSVDPVNPVPCLEKNEKHFDKMLNLACSSNAGGGVGSMKSKDNVKIPVYIPDMRRYVCGHPGCKYLTLTDQMLRSHLNALHGSEKGYLCPHCQEEICKKNMCPERIVQHLKFHGSKIYQCSECEYFHYTKHVVERHVNEKHGSVPFVNLLTYDRSESETKKTSQLFPGRNITTASHSTSGECESPAAELPTTSNTPTNSKMKWECALCKHQTMTWNQMISHANALHNAKHQYHCVHCAFGSAHLAHIMDHIDNKHPTKIREAKYVFYKINESLQDKAADTRPLWSRNDPKRVRSIRGILMENEEDAERTKKNLSRAGVDFDEEDLDDGEYDDVIPVSEEDSSTIIPGGLSCFHCNYTSADMSSLTLHWKTKHWQEKNGLMVPRIPFFFRIHTVLKCPLCPHVGDHINLKIHLISEHAQRNFCAADPNLSNTCGHCPFVYQPKRLEILTNHYLREHKPTDVKNLSSGLLKNLLALGECQVYMQCYFCAEICADKAAIIEHERDRHKSSNFRYKQIKDDVIYRCGMCQYSSTNELATLRHMIDHFSGFSFCHFCKSPQSNFNSYMQHCYSSHVQALAGFKEIYKFDTIASFLGQMLLIFPNGLIINKKNLQHTQYGNTERIQAMYDEICKKALEPPIPPLSMGRLLAAKKSLEAPNQPLLPPPPMAVTAKRIAKRRSTVAMGGCERGLSNFLVPPEPQKIKKRKSSICGDFIQPTAPLFRTITAKSSNHNVTKRNNDGGNVVEEKKEKEPQGFSFYGRKPAPIDLSKIFTHIAIGDKYAPVSVKKFSLLFRINTKVMVESMDHRKYQSKKRISPFSRPCPASKKRRIA